MGNLWVNSCMRKIDSPKLLILWLSAEDVTVIFLNWEGFIELIN